MSNTDIVKSKLYYKKRKLLFKLGWKMGLIRPYSMEFIERCRNVYYGGIPASIMLLSLKHCRHKCYDRAILAACALDDVDFKVMDATIDGIRLHPKTMAEVKYYEDQGIEVNPNYGEHCFLVFNDGGEEWVLDTTDGLIYLKKLYFLMESPKVRKVNDKAATMAFPDYIDIKNADINRDKYILPLLLPSFEAEADESPYKEALKAEIELFKKTIDYDNLVAEIEEEKRVRYGKRAH